MVGRQGCPSQPLQARHSSPEMGSSSDAAQRLALKLQAVYNYPLFLFFSSPGEVPSEQGPGVGCASSSSPATLHVWELNHFLSSPIHTLFEPLLWSWEDRHQGVRLVCEEKRQPSSGDTTPLSDLDFDLSWRLQLTPPLTICDEVVPLNL